MRLSAVAWRSWREVVETGSAGKMAGRQIGILGMEVYFPTTFVEQADLGALLLTITVQGAGRG